MNTVFFILGSIMLVISVLLYEAEEKKFIGLIQELWIRTDDKERKLMRIINSLLEVCFHYSLNILNRLFNANNYFRLFNNSIVLSVCSYCLLSSMGVTGILFLSRGWLVLLGGVTFFIVFWQSNFKILRYATLTISLVTISYFGYKIVGDLGASTFKSALALLIHMLFFIGLIIGFIEDFVLIKVSERLFVWALKRKSFLVYISVILLLLILLVSINVLPIVIDNTIENPFVTAILSNLFTLVPLSLLIVFAILAGLLLLIPNAISRLLYSIQRVDLVSNRLKIASAGVFFILCGIGYSSFDIVEFMKKLGL